jgi:type IV secretory pathway TrbF-like protein
LIEVDKLGQPMAIARADKAHKADQRVIKAMLGNWLSRSAGKYPLGVLVCK